MKNSKKTCGMLGTSIGSMLIIVALLTMVGMGSKDTYAGSSATGETCSCPGSLKRHGNTCSATTVNTQTCTCSYGTLIGDQCMIYTNGENVSAGTCKCPSGYTQSGSTCTQRNTTTAPCTCSSGTPDSSGACIEKEPSSSKPSSSKPSGSTTTPSCVIGSGCTTSSGQPGKCISSGSNYGGTICVPNSPAGGDDDDDKPNKPTKPSGGDDDSKPSSTKCSKGYYYDGSNSCIKCTTGFYCPEDRSYSHSTADINGSGRRTCPNNAKCDGEGLSTFTCKDGYYKNAAETACIKNGSGDTSGGNDGSGGNGGGNGGGNSGGNTGGNGNGGNTGGNGNGGNNNGGNNATRNPNTATKAPLVIAIIGIISVGISSVVYFKGKKEINTEI